jgi:peptidoglycan/xylan/chitin deacetylase (PgdA/CDA1 family)
MNRIVCLAALILAAATPALGSSLVEPRLTIHPAGRQQPHVALTLDACSGRTDMRIFDALVENHIPATIFVTARWLQHNAPALQLLLNHPDLFQIENHGARHLPAIDHPMKVFGLAAAGSPQAVNAEITGGAAAIRAATGQSPRWYRGATGKYSASALDLIARSGETVAGYSLIADDGARLSRSGVLHRLSKVMDGDVIIAHVNHPEKPAGLGLAQGILTLKSRGFVFVKLGTPPHVPHTAQPGT